MAQAQSAQLGGVVWHCQGCHPTLVARSCSRTEGPCGAEMHSDAQGLCADIDLTTHL